MQGRIDRPDYRTALNECLNAQAVEQGPWQRRSGFWHCGLTRGGAAGRVVSFDFKQAAPYNVEFTDGHLRFWAGREIATTNDDAAIVAISIANPAVVQLAAAVTWSTADQGVFKFLATSCPLLQHRTFALTKVDTTHFSLSDAITDATIDGATLGVGALAPGAKLARVLDLASPYIGGDWSDTLLVPTDIPTPQGTTPGAVLLNGAVAPYVLQVATEPTASAFATFTLAAANLKDGPYLDAVAGGTLVTPSATIGLVTMTLSFNTYDATRAYAIGDYVLSVGVNYRSLQDANLNNTPAGAPTFWLAVSGADAIGPNGFQGSDVGRMVRLQSAPDLWVAATVYATGAIVAYGTPEKYWTALAGNTGNIPGLDAINWAPAANATRWTWGKITALSNIIDRALAGSVNIGDMTSGGGLAASFDGVFSKVAALSSESTTTGGAVAAGTNIAFKSFVGKNYSGSAANQKIAQAFVYPSTDQGAWIISGTKGSAGPIVLGVDYSITSVVYNLRAKASAPANSSDGTLLGTFLTGGNFTTQQALSSSDQTTLWPYVWVEQVTTVGFTAVGITAYSITNCISQVSFFNPPGSGTAQGFTLQILGDALLNTKAIRTWRLGRFSNTTGWPTCGTYAEGRLFLGGVTDNHWDASKSNDPLNFAPTNPDGSVGDSSAISYTFNAPDVNPIFGMVPEQQGVVMTTQAGEWLVQATSQNVPLTPTTVQAHRYTKNGCADVEPVRTDHTIIIVQRFRRKILEFFPDVFSGKYSAQNILHKNEPLSKPFIAEVRYQQELIPTIWARMDDGALASVTYARNSLVSSQEALAAPARHTLGSGRTVESITVGPSGDGSLDALAMVTNDPATGLRHVELMATAWEEGDAVASAMFLDDAITPTSTTLSAPSGPAPYGGVTLNGLWAHNGKTVQVFAGGMDCGDRGDEGRNRTTGAVTYTDFTVANGSVFVPFGDGVSAGPGAGLFTASAAAGPFLVGFTYDSDGQIVPAVSPAESGARNGPALGKTSRIHRYAIRVYDTAGLSIGTDFSRLLPAPFKGNAGAGPSLAPGALAQGTYRDDLKGDNEIGPMICWRIARPWPANVSALAGMIHTQDL